MSLTCPKCGSSGEFVRFVPDVGMGGPYEDRRCRNCGHEYQIEIDVDDDPYPPDDGLSIDEQDEYYGQTFPVGEDDDATE